MGEKAVTMGLQGVGLGISELEARKRNKDETREARDYKAKQEDTSMRTEATYRAKRQMLQGAIEDFYKQKGWPMPTIGEGAFTTRPLPGDKPLYEGYDVPRASWNYGKIQPEDVAPVPSPAPAVSPQPIPQIDMASAVDPGVTQGLTDMGITPSAPIAQNKAAPMMANAEQIDPRIEETLRRYGY